MIFEEVMFQEVVVPRSDIPRSDIPRSDVFMLKHGICSRMEYILQFLSWFIIISSCCINVYLFNAPVFFIQKKYLVVLNFVLRFVSDCFAFVDLVWFQCSYPTLSFSICFYC